MKLSQSTTNKIINEASKLVLKYDYASNTKIDVSVLLDYKLNIDKTWLATTV